MDPSLAILELTNQNQDRITPMKSESIVGKCVFGSLSVFSASWTNGRCQKKVFFLRTWSKTVGGWWSGLSHKRRFLFLTPSLMKNHFLLRLYPLLCLVVSGIDWQCLVFELNSPPAFVCFLALMRIAASSITRTQVVITFCHHNVSTWGEGGSVSVSQLYLWNSTTLDPMRFGRSESVNY